MRRLVIAHGLPGHAITILVVGPQRGNAVRRGVAGGLDDQLVGCTGDNLLTPVAEDVAKEAGVVLRRVVQVALTHPATAVSIAAIGAHLVLSGGLVDTG